MFSGDCSLTQFQIARLRVNVGQCIFSLCLIYIFLSMSCRLFGSASKYDEHVSIHSILQRRHGRVGCGAEVRGFESGFGSPAVENLFLLAKQYMGKFSLAVKGEGWAPPFIHCYQDPEGFYLRPLHLPLWLLDYGHLYLHVTFS